MTAGEHFKYSQRKAFLIGYKTAYKKREIGLHDDEITLWYVIFFILNSLK